MKPLKKLTGLGDAIEVVTTVTGIKKATELVSKAANKDCGCNKRRDQLNAKFPFGSNQSEPDADV